MKPLIAGLALGLCGLCAAQGQPPSLATAGLAAAAVPAAARRSPAPPVPIAQGQLRAGTVKEVRGTVELVSDNGRARSAQPGAPVLALDRITTGPDSAAGIVLSDGTTIVVGPSSRVHLKEYNFDAGTQEGGLVMALVRGSLRMLTGLISHIQPEAVRVETPAATIGVRGTDFIVLAEADR